MKPKNKLQTALLVIAVPIVALMVFVGGLYVYVNATAIPIHPDPAGVPSVTSPPAAEKWGAAAARARPFARAAVSKQNLPGLSIAVGAGGEIVWAEGFGYADLEKKTAVTPATRLKAGDASIPLTSAAVGLLVEKGQLSLDADIQKYVPEYPQKEWPVTVRQLMGHVAGVRNDAGDEEPIAERCERTADGVKRFAASPLRFEPGAQFRTSSYGWILVSAAIEAAAHQPFFAFMRGQVFEPLGMSATRPDSMTEAIPDRATLYFPRFGGDTRYGPEAAREGDHACFAGAGAFVSTPSDLVRFGLAVAGGRLLKPATVETLQTPQQLTSGATTDYGLGWTLETVPLAGARVAMAGHGTRTDFIGAATSLMTFPARGLVVAVMSNTSFADTKSVALAVAEAFAEQATTPERK
jgi:CubicO group peptidase (beta-lactamase class C family)